LQCRAPAREEIRKVWFLVTQSDDVSDGKKTEEREAAALSAETIGPQGDEDLNDNSAGHDGAENSAPGEADKTVEAEPEDILSEPAAETEVAETDSADSAGPDDSDPEISRPEAISAETETISADSLSDELISSEAAPVVENRRRGGFLPLLLGGVIAGGIGFGAAQYLLPQPEFDTTALETEIEALQSRIENNAAQIAQPADTSALEATFAAELDAAQARISEQLATFDSRLTALENRPRAEVVLPEEAQALYEAELARMRQTLDAELAGIARAQEAAAKMVADADQTARRAKTVTAYEQIAAAVSSGGAWEGAYGELKALIGDVPATLGEFSASGVPSQSVLVASFPEAARAALNASNAADTTVGNSGGLSGFLRNQLGMRSLQAREGDDADAVLSRAEAALRTGDLEAVFSEIAALPDPAQAQLAPWMENAGARLTVLNALGELSVTVNK
jgi:hypothetical protein